MKKIIIIIFVMLCGCKKELTSVSASVETNAIVAYEPYMQKTVIYRDKMFKDSALLQLPPGYNSTANKYPLLIFFHGTGEAVNDGGLQKLMRLGPPRYMSDSIRLGNFITLCPQDDDGYRTCVNVNDVINAAIKQFRVDTTKIYLTGLSAGARNIMNYVTDSAKYAQRIAAVVPMSIIYMDAVHINRLKYFALYNVHCKIYCGDSDIRYYNNNVAYADSINKAKTGQSEFITYEGAHSGWNHLYKPTRRGDDNVYTWLSKYNK